MSSLSISPIKAYLTRNTQVMSLMDPYITLVLGEQKNKTKTIQSGGRKVQFTQVFTFNSEGDNKIVVTAYDEDKVTDDVIGTGSLDLSQYFRGGIAAILETVSIKYDGKPAGKVLLNIKPSNGNIRENRILEAKKGDIKFYTPEDIIQQLRMNKTQQFPTWQDGGIQQNRSSQQHNQQSSQMRQQQFPQKNNQIPQQNYQFSQQQPQQVNQTSYPNKSSINPTYMTQNRTTEIPRNPPSSYIGHQSVQGSYQKRY